jgi:hypothetical protein
VPRQRKWCRFAPSTCNEILTTEVAFCIRQIEDSRMSKPSTLNSYIVHLINQSLCTTWLASNVTKNDRKALENTWNYSKQNTCDVYNTERKPIHCKNVVICCGMHQSSSTSSDPSYYSTKMQVYARSHNLTKMACQRWRSCSPKKIRQRSKTLDQFKKHSP